MTIEEAIVDLKDYIEYEAYEWDAPQINNQTAQLSIQALGKQMPKKPYIQQAMIDFIDYQAEEDCYECPNCDSFLGYVDECKEESYQDNYCPNCGQKLDWNE